MRKDGFRFNVANFFFIAKLFGDLRRLFAAEVQLAGSSLVRIFVLAIVSIAILTVTWIFMLIILLVYLRSLAWGLLPSLLLVNFINIAILCGIGFYIARLRNNLTFTATRNQLKSLVKR